MTRYGLIVLLLLLPQLSRAQRVVHRVRFGDTLPVVSLYYYGKKDHAPLLAKVNGIALSQGLKTADHIRIPTAWTYTVRKSTRIERLAKKLLDDPRRWTVLKSINKLGRRKRIRAGTKLRVPFTVTHRVAAQETFTNLSKKYFGTPRQAALIANFNFIKGPRPTPGSEIQIPLWQVKILPHRLEDLVNRRLLGVGKTTDFASRSTIQEANAQLRTGEYWAVFLRLIQGLTRQLPSDMYAAQIFKLVAIAYVALDHPEMARDAFKEALTYNPTMSLDPITNSPKVMRALMDAKTERQRSVP